MIRRGDLVVDLDRRKVSWGNREIPLTATEFRLLHFLATHPGRVFSRSELIDNILGRDVEVLDRTVDVHITSLRKKLGKLSSWVETVRGFGYKFRDDDELL